MAKRIAVTLPDDTHAQVKERAAEAGVSAHAWILAAIEREALRQMLEQQSRWNAEHPELVSAAKQDYGQRQEWRARHEGGRDSSAA